MFRSFKLKIYANKGKLSHIDNMLSIWKDTVNDRIDVYWPMEQKTAWPTTVKSGNTITRRASCLAWTLCKTAKKSKQTKPVFHGDTIELEDHHFQTVDPSSDTIFDLWFRLTTLEKTGKKNFGRDTHRRIFIPCKRHKAFNKAMTKGELVKTVQIIKSGKYDYYLNLCVEIPDPPKKSTSRIGIDIGLTNSVATSDGKFYGDEVSEVRKRTKHRKYLDGLSAQRQAWNKLGNQLITTYPETDFVMEDLLFKGKSKKRSKKFRKTYNTWAYKSLYRKLVRSSDLEGFQVTLVDPAYTSQRCPKCYSIETGNRVGLAFCCLACGYQNHSDIVGAINILDLSYGVPSDCHNRKFMRISDER
jgi:IS605 OrfB family transposase